MGRIVLFCHLGVTPLGLALSAVARAIALESLRRLARILMRRARSIQPRKQVRIIKQRTECAGMLHKILPVSTFDCIADLDPE